MNPDVMDHDVTQVVRIFLRVSISIWRTGRDLYDKLTLFYFSLQVVAHPSFSWFTPSPYLFQVSTLRFTRFIRPNAPLLQVQKEKKTTKGKEKKENADTASPAEVRRTASAREAQLDCSMVAAESFCGIEQMTPVLSLGGRGKPQA